MFSWDSSAFLSFGFFHKLGECYVEEITSASHFCLFLLRPAWAGLSARQILCLGVGREQQQRVSRNYLCRLTSPDDLLRWSSYMPFLIVQNWSEGIITKHVYRLATCAPHLMIKTILWSVIPVIKAKGKSHVFINRDLQLGLPRIYFVRGVVLQDVRILLQVNPSLWRLLSVNWLVQWLVPLRGVMPNPWLSKYLNEKSTQDGG